jgi:tetratricopeptide (TPR) repeat protein
MLKRFTLKTNSFKYAIILAFLLLLAACSTKKNNFLSRNSHALSTKYNILYNGQISLDKGLLSIKDQTKDNFWKRLPIEKMQFLDEKVIGDTTKNADFKRAEDKATKAIQKHSMNIDGNEKNFQTDEAYMMLGKARYYDQRFFPALDAFNYILYKYPNSSNIFDAKIWREKTNMRLGNDALVIKNIALLLEEKKLSKQVFANANALLSETYLNLEQKDSALIMLKNAEKNTKINAERARYRFIMGQLYEELGKKDSAVLSYESVIAMNRKMDRQFLMQAYAKKAQLFDYEKGDTLLFVKTFDKLIKNRENKPFLDLLYYQKGLFYDQTNNQKLALEYYNKSLKTKSADTYLNASSYRNLGNRFFKNTDYALAAKYYDSTLVNMEPKTREYIHIKKVRTNLDEVIKYEAIAKRNDSILNVVAMNKDQKTTYFEKYIEKLKKIDLAKKALADKQKQIEENIARNSGDTNGLNPIATNENTDKNNSKAPILPTNTDAKDGARFYFYNPTLVAFGKLQFKKTWGNRQAIGNWRNSGTKNNTATNDASNEDTGAVTLIEDKVKVPKDAIPEQYTADFYQKKLPTSPKVIDSIATERNTVYYKLGIIYKEKLKEYPLATTKLEQLLNNNPEEKLVLPTLYNLYKIYEITNPEKALATKSNILNQYPDSRYAQILKNASVNNKPDSPESMYNNLYRLYQTGHYTGVLEKTNLMITQFSGEEIVSKFELLRAFLIAKTQGLASYKTALQNIVTVYPDSDEGKKAQEILTTEIPLLDQLAFNTTDKKNWKVIFRIKIGAETTLLEQKLNRFIADNPLDKLTYSCDPYNENETFIVLQGMKTEAYAKNIVYEFCDNKKYISLEPAIAISGENYKVVTVKKNLKEYIVPKNQ